MGFFYPHLNLSKFETKLLAVSNTINVDNLIKSIIQKIDKNVVKYCDSSEVLSPKQINDFENNQDDLSPSKINVRKVSDHLIENELVSKLKDILLSNSMPKEVNSKVLLLYRRITKSIFISILRFSQYVVNLIFQGI